MQASSLLDSCIDGTRAITEYESKKRAFKDTEQQCESAGFKFMPLVVESHGGGWGAQANTFFKSLAAAVADIDGSCLPQEIGLLRQRLSTTLQHENARAIIRRVATHDSQEDTTNPAACAGDGTENHFQ